MKDTSQFQKVLLEVYKEFASFCEHNNISMKEMVIYLF